MERDGCNQRLSGGGAAAVGDDMPFRHRRHQVRPKVQEMEVR